ncbi:MAG: DUF1624 domain-containing protein [Sphaerochaetaceae bacterium]|nr:DUF1624 domain-containing protein [Sphaerochaetaceae bacterium]
MKLFCRENYFSKEEVNTGRQPEIDVVKGILILGLMIVHCFTEIFPQESGPVAFFFVILCSNFIGAALFMLIMGMSSMYSKHGSPEDMLRRGFGLLTFAALLNILRVGLPNSIAYLINGEKSYLLNFALIIGNDIMWFAGLAFLTGGLLRRGKLNDMKMLIVAVVMSIAGYFLKGVGTGNYGIDQLLGHIWGTKTESCFPLFNWFVFFTVGRLYGTLYRHLKDKREWSKKILPIGLVISVVYVIIATNPDQKVFVLFNDDPIGLYWMAPLDAVFCLVGGITALALACLVVKKDGPVFLTFIGRNLNKFYCVSWVIINFVATVIRIIGVWGKTGSLVTVAVCSFVIVLTYLIVLLYKKSLEEKFRKFFGKHRKLWIVMMWVIVAVAAVAIIVYGQNDFPGMYNGYLD